MEFQDIEMTLALNKDKSIGEVIFIVEGAKTEFHLLHKIFTTVFDYQYEAITRHKAYRKYNSKHNPLSRVIVINTEESNIKFIDDSNEYLNNLFIDDSNEYLNNLFIELIDCYSVDIVNSAIYYIFDRDVHSNTDASFIESLLRVLKNSRDNGHDYYMQGLLLLSYPAIESFILANLDGKFQELTFETGKVLKAHLHQLGMSHRQIDESTLLKATEQMECVLKQWEMGDYNLDAFHETNLKIFHKQEVEYEEKRKYKALSLLSIALLDLGLISYQKKR